MIEYMRESLILLFLNRGIKHFPLITTDIKHALKVCYAKQKLKSISIYLGYLNQTYNDAFRS